MKKVTKNIVLKLCELHNDLPFLPERKKIEKDKKLIANLHDKTKFNKNDDPKRFISFSA